MSDFKNLPTVNGVAVSLVSHSHSYQPLDTELTAFAALVSAADKLPYFNGAGTMALADLTAFGRSLAAAADAAAGRTALGLGTAAVIADNTLVHIAGAETIAGAKTFAAALMVDGSADAVQLRVQAHSTQTLSLQEWQSSAAAALSWIDQLGRYRGTAGAWVKNSLVGLLSQEAADDTMMGVYDRNELANAALRGIVTVTITGAGTYTDTVAQKQWLFDGIAGNFFSISGTDATTTQVVIHIDMLTALPNFGSATWCPFIQYRLSMASGFQATYFANIVCEVSEDNTNWYKPATGWTTTDPGAVELVPGYWFGVPGWPNPITSPRYVRFTLTDRRENAAYGSKASIWIAELGLRHRATLWTRYYAPISGADFYGDLTQSTAGVLPTAYNTKLFQSGAAVFNEQGADVDFRVEGDTKQNLLLVDASADTVSVDGILTVTGVSTFSGNVVVSGGNSIILTDPDVAQPITGVFPTTTQYGNIGIASSTAGGIGIVGISDSDSNPFFAWAIFGSADPADTTPAFLLRADKSNTGTGVAALAAAETHTAWANSGTTVMRLLGNGDLFMISGSKLVTETIQAVDATGLVFKDDAAATYGVLEDGGFWGFGGITNPNVMVHLQRAASGQDLKLQQSDATNDYARVVLHDSADNYLFGFETGSGTHRHTFADGFVPASDYAAAYTAAANPLYFGTSDIVRLSLLAAGNVFVGLTTGLANVLGIRAGASTVTNDAAVGGVLLINTTQVASDTAVQGILASYTVPANTLAVNGQSIWFEASGTLTNGASLAGFQVRLGSQAFLSSETMGGVTTNGFFNIRGRIIRTGAATQKGYVTHTLIHTSGVKTDARYKAFTLTLSSANDLTIRHETDLTAGDIVLETFVVGWDDANV